MRGRSPIRTRSYGWRGQQRPSQGIYAYPPPGRGPRTPPTPAPSLPALTDADIARLIDNARRLVNAATRLAKSRALLPGPAPDAYAPTLLLYAGIQDLALAAAATFGLPPGSLAAVQIGVKEDGSYVSYVVLTVQPAGQPSLSAKGSPKPLEVLVFVPARIVDTPRRAPDPDSRPVTRPNRTRRESIDLGDRTHEAVVHEVEASRIADAAWEGRIA